MSLPTILAVAAVVLIVAVIAYAVYNALFGDSSGGGGDAGGSGGSGSGSNTAIHDHSQGDANCAACKNASQPVNATVPEKVLVNFRPKANWKGEFGFDWMREADTGMVGDVDYETIVGKYGNVYATESTAVFTLDKSKYAVLKGTNYNAFPISWKKISLGNTYLYSTAWLALFPKDQCTGNNKKCEAELVLYSEVYMKEPEMIRIDYNKEYFELDKSEVTPKSLGKNNVHVTIKCIKEFDTDQEIKVIPFKTGGEDALAGKLMVLKNNKANRYKANVVFVKVTTKINTVVKNGSTANEKDFLEKYLFQSLTSLNLVEESLNLSADTNFNTKYTLQLNAVSKGINVYLADGSKIHSYLETKLNTLKPEYTSWYKVFFFDENGGYNTTNSTTGAVSYTGLNGGAADIPSKCVALFNGHNTATTTHELLHAMGIYHTFDNDGLYVYKIGQTENIMDYSHQSAYGSKTRTTLWKWQWDKLHAAVSKE